MGEPYASADQFYSGLVHVRRRVDGTFVHEDTFDFQDLVKGEFFGRSVTIRGDVMAAGAPGAANENGVSTGAVVVFEDGDDGFSQSQVLAPADLHQHGSFGASVDTDGRTMAVGAPRADGDEEKEGAVFLFEQVDGVWTEVALLRAPDPIERAEFGASVAVEGDFLIVGAPGNSRAGEQEGAAHAYRRVDGIFGCDGAYSAVRSRLQRTGRFSYEQEYLEHGYKELTIPSGAGGGPRLDPHALHIWPRGAHMMIALPNLDGSFTCTLFWPYAGAGGFETIDTRDEVLDTFRRQFPDAVPVMPDLVDEYLANPVGSLVTIRCAPWYRDDRALLVGDAAHAVVPFYGQGANAALEDCLLVMDEIDRHDADWAAAFRSFAERRKPDTDALADLALDNFIEMRDHVASRWFLAHSALERAVHRRLPSLLVPLYTMVTFSRLPYGEAVRRARRQRIVLRIVLIALAALVAVVVVGAVIATQGS